MLSGGLCRYGFTHDALDIHDAHERTGLLVKFTREQGATDEREQTETKDFHLELPHKGGLNSMVSFVA